MALLFPPHRLPPGARYERLFRSLPPLPCAAKPSPRGRPGFSQDALLRALIYARLRTFPHLCDLTFELSNNPSILLPLGFDLLSPTPSVERFSAFLHDTPNPSLQDLHHQLVFRLAECHAISACVLALDSCPVPAPVRENNLKTGLRTSRFDKTSPPKGDPQAGLGVRIHYPTPSSKKPDYFWGYRNHALTDVPSEIPLFEATFPANVPERTQAIPLLSDAVLTYCLTPQAILADAEFDSEKILAYILHDLHAKPYIPKNPRRAQSGHYHIAHHQILCQANLPMFRKGRMTSKGISYIQYSCPLHYPSKHRQHLLFCPAEHPKFISQKGCNALLRQTPSLRSHIDYGSEDFRLHRNQRTAAERVFSRLLALAMQHPTVRGLRPVQNHCTIAHITTCLVALVACEEGHSDKLRFVRSFVPNFLA